MKACAPIIAQSGPVVLYNRGQFVGRLPGPSKRRASLSRGAPGLYTRARVVVLHNPVYGTFKTLHSHRHRPSDPSQGPQRCPWHLPRRGVSDLATPAARRGADPLNQRTFPSVDRKPPAAKKARPNLDRPFLLGVIRSALLLAGSGPSVRPFWPLPFVLPSFPGIRPRVPLRCRCGSMRPSRCRATPAQK